MKKSAIKPPPENAKVKKSGKSQEHSAAEILESLTDAFYTVDADWRLTYVNHKSEEWWKRRREELLGTKLWDLFPEPKQTVDWRMIHQAASERMPVRWETFYPDCQTWVGATAYPMSDGGLAVYFRDITERKRAEEELKEAHRKNTEILESIRDGFFSLDRDWRFTYINWRGTSILGLLPGEVIGRKLWELSPHLLGTGIEKFYRKAMQERASVQFEHTGIGSDIWYEIRVYPTGDGGISIYWINRSERKRAEETLQQSHDALERRARERTAELERSNDMLKAEIEEHEKAQKALLQAKEQIESDRKRLEIILETIPSAVALVGASDGKYLYANRRAIELYGYNYVGFDLEAHAAKVKTLKPDGTPCPLEEMPVSHSLKFGKKVRKEEMIIESPDGISLPVLVSSAPLFDTEGKITTAIIVFEDNHRTQESRRGAS